MRSCEELLFARCVLVTGAILSRLMAIQGIITYTYTTSMEVPGQTTLSTPIPVPTINSGPTIPSYTRNRLHLDKSRIHVPDVLGLNNTGKQRLRSCCGSSEDGAVVSIAMSAGWVRRSGKSIGSSSLERFGRSCQG